MSWSIGPSMRAEGRRAAPIAAALRLGAMLAFTALTGCIGGTGGGGAFAYSGGAAGAACDPTVQHQGCLATAGGLAVMACGTDGVWAQLVPCGPQQTCTEQATAASTPGGVGMAAQCVDIAVQGGAAGGDGGGGLDGGAGSDGAAGNDGGGANADAGATDSGGGGADAGQADVGVADVGVADAGVVDTSPADAGAPDTGAPDTGAPDTGPPDTGAPDSGPPDTGPPTKPLPVVHLEDFNPASPTGGLKVTLDAYKGKYLAILMGAGWCASCNAQADFMEKIRKDFVVQGRDDFVMIVVNDKSAASASYKKQMITCDYSVCSPKGSLVGFPVLQGTSQYGWHSFVDPKTGQKGAKNDCFIYAPDGGFLFKHVGKATVNLTQFDKEVRAALSL